MRILIRVDAAPHIGIGHVMRCLTLANALKMVGAEVCFICRMFSGHLGERIVAEGHLLYLLPPATQVIKSGPDLAETPPHAAWLGEDWETDLMQTQEVLGGKHFDWLVVDHYSLDVRWESAMRKFARKIMVIDDLADRMHDCDLLLDQNLGRDEGKYRPWVPENCTLLAGSKYALLRPEFAKLREYSLKRRVKSKIEHLLIAFGGIDKANATGKVLESLKESSLPADCHITVVIGATPVWLDAVKKIAETMPWPTEIQVDVSNMAQLMAESDLCIGAAGSTSWERCCLGVPTLLTVLSSNQREAGVALEKEQAVLLFNGASGIKENIEVLCRSAEKMDAMSLASSRITDGSGLENVMRHMKRICARY